MVVRCLVVGSARNWQEDVEAACELAEFQKIVVVKRTGIVWPGKVDVWVGLHNEMIESMYNERMKNGYPKPEKVYSWEKPPKVKRITHTTEILFPGQTLSASSGIFGAKVALIDEKYDLAVLCGIPLDPKQGRFDHGKDWTHARSFIEGFNQAVPAMKHRVRSMSGYTQKVLGAPTIDWLNTMPHTGV